MYRTPINDVDYEAHLKEDNIDLWEETLQKLDKGDFVGDRRIYHNIR